MRVSTFFIGVFVALTIVACKRIREVEVSVIDNQTAIGISDINLYHGDSKYVTNSDGYTIIRGKNLQGSEVTINRSNRGYSTPDFHKDCQFKQSYLIEDKKLMIRLEKLRSLKSSFLLPVGVSSSKGCLIIDDLEHCDGKISLYFELNQKGFVYPDESGVNKNIISTYMNKSSSPWKISIYYDTFCEFDHTTRKPDQIEEIPMDPNNDTTYYTVHLR